jgi:hypothetical protein
MFFARSASRPRCKHTRNVVNRILGKIRPALLTASILCLAAHHGTASAQRVRITGLNDVTFGELTSLQFDASRQQNVCVFSNTRTNGYSIVASGSGLAGSFELASGSSTLPFEVQWAESPGRSIGTSLVPNLVSQGFTSSATHQNCNSGPPAAASLIVIVRGTALSQATAGSYSGSLTLLVVPE